MNLPASHVVQSLLYQLGEHRSVHEQESALQYATEARKSMHFMAEPWGQDVRTRWGQPGFPSISHSLSRAAPSTAGP